MTCPTCTQLMHTTGQSKEKQRTSPFPLQTYYRCLGCGRHWIHDRDHQGFSEIAEGGRESQRPS